MAPSVGLRLRALATLVVFVASLGLPMVSFGHYGLEDDLACGSVSLTEAHPGVQLDQARPKLPPNHCAVCHWLRAVGGSHTTGITLLHAWLEPAEAPVATAEHWRPAPAVSARPSRAPPSLIG
jgi:hypothetical protein